ncbi:MAG: hypothetical protein HY052_00300 [Proteobacteria bacterium]|nr:hypothetical protein [Pseudomonadota bacterium]
MGIFKKMFGKDCDKPGQPEERRIPDFAKSFIPAEEIWVTGQVFAGDKKDKNRRIYYAFRYKPSQPDAGPEIYKCSYQINRPDEPVQLKADDWEHSLLDAVKYLARRERNLLSCGCTPVLELKGNYRDVANLEGWIFNDRGECIPIGKDTLVTSDALFKRDALDAIYGSKTKESDSAPVIATWDDFYREIVNKTESALKPNETTGNNKSDYLKRFRQAMRDTSLSFKQKEDLLSEIRSLGWVGNNSDPTVYRGTVTLLTELLRAGGELYQQFATSVPAEPETLRLLKTLGESVVFVARTRLDLPATTAEQLAKLIVQGPDPYADKSSQPEEPQNLSSPPSPEPSQKKTPAPKTPKGYSP